MEVACRREGVPVAVAGGAASRRIGRPTLVIRIRPAFDGCTGAAGTGRHLNSTRFARRVASGVAANVVDAKAAVALGGVGARSPERCEGRATDASGAPSRAGTSVAASATCRAYTFASDAPNGPYASVASGSPDRTCTPGASTAARPARNSAASTAADCTITASATGYARPPMAANSRDATRSDTSAPGG